MQSTNLLHFRTSSLLLIPLLLFSSSLFSQNPEALENAEIYSQHGVSISSALENCENIHNGTAKQYLLLNIKNETTSRLEVSFKRNTWYNGICSSCNSSSSENTAEVTIEPNSELKGECDANNGLRIFSKMLNLNNVRQLTHYELVDVIVHEAD